MKHRLPNDLEAPNHISIEMLVLWYL